VIYSTNPDFGNEAFVGVITGNSRQPDRAGIAWRPVNLTPTTPM
jgi:hypothetical protein